MGVKEAVARDGNGRAAYVRGDVDGNHLKILGNFHHDVLAKCIAALENPKHVVAGGKGRLSNKAKSGSKKQARKNMPRVTKRHTRKGHRAGRSHSCRSQEKAFQDP